MEKNMKRRQRVEGKKKKLKRRQGDEGKQEDQEKRVIRLLRIYNF
jgi:hypothetical protein